MTIDKTIVKKTFSNVNCLQSLQNHFFLFFGYANTKVEPLLTFIAHDHVFREGFWHPAITVCQNGVTKLCFLVLPTPSLIAHVTETACKYSMINICAGVYAFLFDKTELLLDVSH